MKLKTCPFCGSKNLDTVRFIAATWMHMVRCMNCRAEGPNVKESGSIEASKLAAVDLWNDRA